MIEKGHRTAPHRTVQGSSWRGSSKCVAFLSLNQVVSFCVFAGISMHKGYAFVQFTNPFDARNACLGEDGRTVLGQVLGESTLLLYCLFSIRNNR